MNWLLLIGICLLTWTDAQCSPNPCVDDEDYGAACGISGSTYVCTCSTGFSFDGTTCIGDPCDGANQAIPGNGSLGDCEGETPHMGTCSYSCDPGFQLEFISVCVGGSLGVPECLAGHACDTSIGPENGNHGGCPTTQMNDGDTCAYECNEGYYLTQATSCNMSALSRGECLLTSSCALDPCENNASCTDLLQDFSCNCTEGWDGKYCSYAWDTCGTYCAEGFCNYTTAQCLLCAYMDLEMDDSFAGDVKEIVCQVRGLPEWQQYLIAGGVVLLVLGCPCYLHHSSEKEKKQAQENNIVTVQKSNTNLRSNMEAKRQQTQLLELQRMQLQMERRRMQEEYYLSERRRSKKRRKGRHSDSEDSSDDEEGANNLQAYKTAFESFDTDGDGTITEMELGVALLKLGDEQTPAELKKLFQQGDTDNSGTIEFPEFLLLMMKREEALNAEKAARR